MKLHKNVCAHKQAGRLWYKCLINKLLNKLGLENLKVIKCVFYQERTINVIYTDNYIFVGIYQDEIDQAVKYLHISELDVTVQVNGRRRPRAAACSITLERITVDWFALYCCVPPLGENIPISIEPFPLDELLPK